MILILKSQTTYLSLMPSLISKNLQRETTHFVSNSSWQSCSHGVVVVKDKKTQDIRHNVMTDIYIVDVKTLTRETLIVIGKTF